ATKIADTAGLPTPATPGERIGSAAVSALPSAVVAPEITVPGLLAAGGSGVASQVVAENGGSPLQQTLAGLVAGVGGPLAAAGTAAAVRGAVRGGSAGAAAMQERLANAAANDTRLSVGQASGSRLVQRVEGASSKVWGGGPIKATAEKQAEA